jgi:putative transposase
LTTLRQFARIVPALLAMTGRITMLGIARWTGEGASYRTVQRFFATAIPWISVFWLFFRSHLFETDDVYLLAGDETVVSKAGKHTPGLDRFFASLYGKPIPGLAFFALSLVSIKQRRSFPIAVEQVVRTAEQKAATQSIAAKPTTERKPGRPKGKTTKAKTSPELSQELARIQKLLLSLLERIGGVLPLSYLVLDGHFGNAGALEMAQSCKLHLISKLRSDSALYLPYDGAYAGRGPKRIYGDKLNPRAIPEKYLRHTHVEKGVERCTYQFQARHKTFAQPLNVVCIVKTNLKTQAQAHVLLFSSDLAVGCDNLVDYYSLRFQLEFNFRDAKQYWGLEDFVTTQPTRVTNAANLALFMVNLAERLLRDERREQGEMSVLDLKAQCRGAKYVDATIKLLPKRPEPSLLKQITAQVMRIGRIHAAPADPIPA